MAAAMPIPNGKEVTLEMLRKQFSGASVYALLLNGDASHPVAEAVRKHWSELHNLTGKEITLVAFDPPTEWTENLKDYWKKELGPEFERIWAKWQKPPAPGLALSYLDLFSGAQIKATDLPCLVLFTDLDQRQAVVRSLPAWEPEKLYRLLLSIFDDVRGCCARPKESRLECLRDKLNSPGAKALTFLEHYAEEAFEYVKKNPAAIVGTTAGFLATLATGNVLPLGAGMVGVLQAVSSLRKS